jgi:hypothetical protein
MYKDKKWEQREKTKGLFHRIKWANIFFYPHPG